MNNKTEVWEQKLLTHGLSEQDVNLVRRKTSKASLWCSNYSKKFSLWASIHCLTISYHQVIFFEKENNFSGISLPLSTALPSMYHIYYNFNIIYETIYYLVILFYLAFFIFIASLIIFHIFYYHFITLLISLIIFLFLINAMSSFNNLENVWGRTLLFKLV